MTVLLETTALSRSEWIARAEAHAERADALTAAHRARAARGQTAVHPEQTAAARY